MEIPLEFRSLNEIAGLIKSKEISPCYILERLIERIEKLDTKVQSYARLNSNALEECRKIEKLSEYVIPVSVKDLFDTKNIETNYGSMIYRGNIPGKDATVVKNIRKKGGIIIGKTVTHEFALGITSSPTKNPWDLRRIPGGSSGGSAAAGAAGMSVFATGTDTGGSIRIPAAMCGVTGLKPTYELISRSGIFPESWSLDHAGPITRYAGDLILELEFMTGKIYPSKREETENLKVGVAWELFDYCEPGVRKASLAALEKIRGELNIEYTGVREENLKFKEMKRLHEIIDTCEIALIHRENYAKYPDSYLKSSIEQIEEGLSFKAVEYINAKRSRKKYRELLDAKFRNLDVILIPTLKDVAPIIDNKKNTSEHDNNSEIDFLSPLNYSGNPAISIPVGFSKELPVGMQVIGRNNSDLKCIEFASLVQDRTDWHKTIPPGFS